MYTAEDIVQELLDVDEEVGLEAKTGLVPWKGEKYRVVLVGGSVFFVLGMTNRLQTVDADTLSVDHAISHVLEQHGLFDRRVLVYEDQLPYNYEDRLRELPIPTNYVAFLAPSNEDLAVMKLCAWRDSDKQDLGNAIFLQCLDWEKLDYLVRVEAPMSRACDVDVDRRYQEMLGSYEEFKRLHKEVGDA